MRPQADLAKAATTGEVVDRFTEQTWNLSPGQIQTFVDLSIVIELEGLEQDPSMVDRHGAYFRSLFAAWAPVASQQVIGQPGRRGGASRGPDKL